MYTSASELLYNASRHHVYWKEIKILVPPTWSPQEHYGVAKTETLETAHVTVHSGSPRGDEPYVDNPFGCGQQIILTHISPAFISDKFYREEIFGPTESVLVRIWAYFRWGLFEEHYDAALSEAGVVPAYDAGGRSIGTRCSANIEGEVMWPDYTPCNYRDGNNIGYPTECRFIPIRGQTVTSSLLFGTKDFHIPTINEFCDDDPESPNFHNAEALNLQNKRCGNLAAWTVMREKTSDFDNGPQVVTNTKPIFTVIQAPLSRSVVIVLDKSGSMSGNERFIKVISASTEYIRNVIPMKSRLGIVYFDSSASVGAELTRIVDDQTRESLVNSLPPTEGGGTSISNGIQKGIEVLGEYSPGGYILILGDGEDQSNYVEDNRQLIESSGVIIDTITVSSSGDSDMRMLADITLGESYHCIDTDSGNCLIQAFQSTITSRPSSVAGQTTPVQIYSSDVQIQQNVEREIVPLVIDSALGNDTVFTVTWTGSNPVKAVVTGWEGTRIDHNDPRYHEDATNKIISVTLPSAKPGQWNVTIINTQPSNPACASVAVTSKPSSREYSPVTVTAILGSTAVDFSTTPALAIYAQVQQGYESVSNADVEAIITDEQGTKTTISLLDNGSGSDLLKEDGVFSGYFLQFTSNGRYNVKVNVVGYELTESGDIIGIVKRDVTATEEEKSVPSFMRTASGGMFEVANYQPNAPDSIAPSRIHDLTYTSFSYSNTTISLTWTAVGDDLDQGKASSYELRYTTTFSVIQNNFTMAQSVSEKQTIIGNLSSIAPAGNTESITIELPARRMDIVYYFAIRAWDEADNVGDKSNIASVSIRYIPDPTPQQPTQTEPWNIETTSKGEHQTCALNVVFLAAAVAVAWCFAKQIDNLVRDKFIDKCASKPLRQRLVREPSLKLAELMTIARASEAADKQASLMESELLKTYPTVFEGLGKLLNYQVHVHVDPGVRPVAQPPRSITTFSTNQGLMRYKLLIFGLSSASEIYQHAIQQALSGLNGVRNISNDIIVFGNDVDHQE
ncbi:calcium-activated chloride channel regulator 1-like [Diadema antillarum]|uniref:calcium-activated chloride channel regulator 1-like n=1 Tax=Diadema antillarum TaxID=105358 RepID=UPI003A872AE3